MTPIKAARRQESIVIGQKLVRNTLWHATIGNMAPCGGVEHAFAFGPVVTFCALRQTGVRGHGCEADKKNCRQRVVMPIHSDPEI